MLTNMIVQNMINDTNLPNRNGAKLKMGHQEPKQIPTTLNPIKALQPEDNSMSQSFCSSMIILQRWDNKHLTQFVHLLPTQSWSKAPNSFCTSALERATH